jgi:hypothetical protein
MRKLIMLALAMITAVIVSCAAPTATASSGPVPATTQKCGAPYRADGTMSLRDIAAFVASSPVSQLLADTAWCYTVNTGQVVPQYPPNMVVYINNGNFDALVPAGTRLWFTALP